MTKNKIDFEDHLPGWFWIPVLLLVFLIIASLALPPNIFEQWLANERTGLLELSHVVIPIISLFIAVRILFHHRLTRFSWLWYWILTAAVCCFYLAGEEASWGQHWFLWETSSKWATINDQGETNLHNTSSWLDQKPRLILELGIIIGGIILPLVRRYKPHLINEQFSIIIPTMVLLPTALIAEVTRRSDTLFRDLGYSFHLFPRPSEVQETFYVLFIMFYLIIFRQRLNNATHSFPITQNRKDQSAG